MTRVLIDARALHDEHSRDRGFGRYLWQLLTALGAIDAADVTALVDRAVELPAGIRRRNTRRLAPGRYVLQEHALRLAMHTRLPGIDVFHSPALDPPVRASRPWVQTLHDVTPLAYPDPGFAAMSADWLQRAVRMRGADMVVAVSQSAADDGARFLGLDPARIRVIHHGADPAFRPASQRREPDPPYLLVVGGWGPNKGYAEAFEVVGRLAALGHPHHLRLTGRLKELDRVEVDRLLAAAPRPDRVDLLGLVPSDELVTLYQGATAVLIPSRYEGFGLPALEAMACGTPVVAFANSAIPEVVGNGGILVPDGDAASMAEAVANIIRRADVAEGLTKAGIARARQFDWASAAGKYLEVYEACAAARSLGSPGK